MPRRGFPEQVLENPFTAGDWSAAAERWSRIDLARELAAAADGPERIVLGAVTAFATRGPEAAARLLSRLPKSVRLPRPRSAYLRVALAAERCRGALAALAGRSEAMQRVRRQTWSACFGQSLLHALELERLIRDHDVLITGETGTGKEAVARAIQEGTLGDDSGGPAPRAALNAAAIPDPLVESELFGHVRGAFTGAAGDRPGRIRSAAGGCFFLDEVGDLPLTAQAKLLRVMETNRVSPVGSDREYDADVRYVAATHQDLGAMVRAGSFRRDLEQRLAGVVIALPPLRERPDDIADIGAAFVEHELWAEHHAPNRHRIARWLESAEARRYPWPGNVRELESALRNMMLGLAPSLGSDRSSAAADRQQMESELPAAILAGTATLSAASDWYLERVLRAHGDNFAAAARVLGVDRSTVKRRAQRRRTEG